MPRGGESPPRADAGPHTRASNRGSRSRFAHALGILVLAGVIDFGRGAPVIAATEAEKVVYVRDLKRMQVDIMMQQAKREMAERNELLRRYRARLRHPGQRLTFPRTREEREAVTRAHGSPAPDVVLAGLAPNRRMNNRSTDVQSPSTQSEV